MPGGEFSILESYLRAIRSAERLVYLESQFLWSPELVAELERKLRNPPDDGFRLVVVLPTKPNNGGDDTRGQLGRLAAADAGAGRFLACSLHQPGDHSRPVYVHAKVGIVDDRWLTIGSANLNEHSLFNDTEVNLATRDAALARATRLRLWSEHLERDASELEGDTPRSSTSSGARRRTGSCACSRPADRSPASSSSCRASRVEWVRCAGRSTGSSSTARRLDSPGRES